MLLKCFELYHPCRLSLQTSSIGDVDATPQKSETSPSAALEQDVSVHLVLPITFHDSDFLSDTLAIDLVTSWLIFNGIKLDKFENKAH